MRITSQLTDAVVLEEWGARLAKARLVRNLTQAVLAERAGVSKHTIERLESGEVSTRLSSFVRVCRVLGFLEGFDALLPETMASPIAQLKLQGRKRQRASGLKAAKAKLKNWTWGESS
jgi:transcriptional regulator with XRE-family HTH domain